MVCRIERHHFIIYSFYAALSAHYNLRGIHTLAGTQKVAEISNKNSSFNWVHSIRTGSMNVSHSTNLFTDSCHYISTNGKAPPHFHLNLQHPTIPQVEARISSVFLSQVEHVIRSLNLLTLKRKIQKKILDL